MTRRRITPEEELVLAGLRPAPPAPATEADPRTDTEREADEQAAASRPEADWSVLEDERVVETIAGAAKWVSERIDGVHTADDLSQEATIFCATNADEVRSRLDDDHVGTRALFLWLINCLRDKTRADVNRARRHVPLHIHQERAGE